MPCAANSANLFVANVFRGGTTLTSFSPEEDDTGHSVRSNDASVYCKRASSSFRPAGGGFQGRAVGPLDATGEIVGRCLRTVHAGNAAVGYCVVRVLAHPVCAGKAPVDLPRNVAPGGD